VRCGESDFATQPSAGSTNYPQADKTPSLCHRVDFPSGDNRFASDPGFSNNDWDSGYYKGECAPNEYVTGVAQSTSGWTTSIECCLGNVTHQSCTAHPLDSSGLDTDWDSGYLKGTCPLRQYVAGVSTDFRAGGSPHMVLCCAP
jgi:hypothetical protein